MDIEKLTAALKNQTSGQTDAKKVHIPVKFDLGNVTIRGYIEAEASTPDEFVEQMATLIDEGWPVDAWENRNKYHRSSYGNGNYSRGGGYSRRY